MSSSAAAGAAEAARMGAWAPGMAERSMRLVVRLAAFTPSRMPWVAEGDAGAAGLISMRPEEDLDGSKGWMVMSDMVATS